ncbi:serine hydrolase [Cytobacillus suaedae]|nr:serine hydrolase [Cytobacillus suaedae]
MKKYDIQTLELQIKRLLDSYHCQYSVAIKWDGGFINIDASAQRVAASLIKIPILFEAYRQYQKGIIDINVPIQLTDEEKVGGAGVLSHLTSQVQLTLKDLLTLMIIVSDNTATNMVIDRVGVTNINKLCQQVGCTETKLERRLMDFKAIEEGRNNYTSARDMVVFLEQILSGELLTEQSKKEIFKIMRAQQFIDKLPSQIQQSEGDTYPIVANKTGELPGVEHDVAIIKLPHVDLTIAVLLTQLESNFEGKAIIGKIGKIVVEGFQEQFLSPL